MQAWRTNPTYSLVLHGEAGKSADVRVTLSRPADRWIKQVKSDAVACMLGFYILPWPPSNGDSTQLNYRAGETFQTDFVPMNQVSTPLGFTMEVRLLQTNRTLSLLHASQSLNVARVREVRSVCAPRRPLSLLRASQSLNVAWVRHAICHERGAGDVRVRVPRL